MQHQTLLPHVRRSIVTSNIDAGGPPWIYSGMAAKLPGLTGRFSPTQCSALGTPCIPWLPFMPATGQYMYPRMFWGNLDPDGTAPRFWGSVDYTYWEKMNLERGCSEAFQRAVTAGRPESDLGGGMTDYASFTLQYGGGGMSQSYGKYNILAIHCGYLTDGAQ